MLGLSLLQARDVQFLLAGVARGSLNIAGDELDAHPAKYVVDDRRSSANLRVLGEAGWLEPLMAELAHQSRERHAVLQGDTRQSSSAVHQSSNGRSLLGHSDEHLAGCAVLEQADRQIALVAGDIKFVSYRLAGLGQAPAERLVDLFLQTDQLILQLLNPLIRRDGEFTLGALAGLGGVERLGPLRSVAINRDALEPQFPRLCVGVGNIRDRALPREIDGLGYGAAYKRLGSGHHLQMCHVVNATLAAERLERAIKHIQMFGLEPASTGFPVLLDVLDGVKFFNMGDDVFHLVRRVT